MITTLAVSGYRSVRSLVLPLSGLDVVTGANGSGKSSLYRSLRLLASAADDGVVAALAREGGLPSTLWAGPEQLSRDMRAGDAPVQGGRRSAPVSVRLGFGADDLGYLVDLGVPPPGGSAFVNDPEIKREQIFSGPVARPAALLVDRSGPGVRRSIRRWRFYDHLRTDRDAPARRPQVGTSTPVLSASGDDLAACLQTLAEQGAGDAVDAAVDRAFPGTRLEVASDATGMFRVRLRQPGMLRPIEAHELSDGTLRFLLLTAALLSTRPPELLVLNEPETSLHADLLPALADLVAAASASTQMIVVTHARPLVDAVRERADAREHRLVKPFGETLLDGQGVLDAPPWHWTTR